MDKRLRTALVIGGLAIGAWILYSWYKNRQSGTGSTQLGTNLNSIAPELIGGSTGPNSGLTYNAGAINLYYSAPVTQSSTSSNPGSTSGGGHHHNFPHGLNPGGPIQLTQPVVGIAGFNPGGGFRK